MELMTIMARLAGNRRSALLTGAAVTAIVQSSSVTSAIAIGFGLSLWKARLAAGRECAREHYNSARW
jgi:type IV secretory pathway TrbD component